MSINNIISGCHGLINSICNICKKNWQIFHEGYEKSVKKIQIFQTDYEKSVIFFTNISIYKEKKKKEKKIEREEDYAPTAFSPTVLFR